MQSATEQRRGLRQKCGVTPLTEVRARRLIRGLSLFAVAERSGISSSRVSRIERDPSIARPEELEAHRNACDQLFAEKDEETRGAA